VEIITHSPHKDFTDAEIALDLATGRGHDSIIIVSGGGDRFDHLMALVHSMVAHARRCSLEAYVGRTHISFVHGGDARTFDAVAGDTVSLIPLGGDALGVTTSGLKWELSGDALKSFASRGVSNQALASRFDITVTNGHLAVLRPLDI
jgi:thiamine pyrophosphokinase